MRKYKSCMAISFFKCPMATLLNRVVGGWTPWAVKIKLTSERRLIFREFVLCFLAQFSLPLRNKIKIPNVHKRSHL